MKKIIMMLVTMFMILSLVACGSGKETGSSETAETGSYVVTENQQSRSQKQ